MNEVVQKECIELNSITALFCKTIKMKMIYSSVLELYVF